MKEGGKQKVRKKRKKRMVEQSVGEGKNMTR